MATILFALRVNPLTRANGKPFVFLQIVLALVSAQSAILFQRRLLRFSSANHVRNENFKKVNEAII